MTRITFPEDDGPQFELLPEGIYRAQIWAIDERLGEQSQQPYMAFDFRIEQSPRHLFDNFSLQPQALWRLKRLFETLGLPSKGTLDIDWDNEVVGLRVQLVVEHKESRGKMREAIVEYRNPSQTGLDEFGEVPF